VTVTKTAFSGGEDLAGSVGELGFGVVGRGRGCQETGGWGELLAEGDGAEVLDLRFAGHGEDAAGAVDLLMGFVEEGGDDAAVGVGREVRQSGGRGGSGRRRFCRIDEEFEAKAGGVIEPAAEAVIEGSVGQRSESGLVGVASRGVHLNRSSDRREPRRLAVFFTSSRSCRAGSEFIADKVVSRQDDGGISHRQPFHRMFPASSKVSPSMR